MPNTTEPLVRPLTTIEELDQHISQPRCGCQVVWSWQCQSPGSLPIGVDVRNVVACSRHASDLAWIGVLTHAYRGQLMNRLKRATAGDRPARTKL